MGWVCFLLDPLVNVHVGGARRPMGYDLKRVNGPCLMSSFDFHVKQELGSRMNVKHQLLV